MSRLPSPIKAEDLLPETLYSTLHRFATLSASTSSLSYAPHPFGSSDQANATQEIRDLLTTAERVSFALNAHYGQHYADAKLVSLLKQHASISHALHQVSYVPHFEWNALLTETNRRTRAFSTSPTP